LSNIQLQYCRHDTKIKNANLVTIFGEGAKLVSTVPHKYDRPAGSDALYTPSTSRIVYRDSV